MIINYQDKNRSGWAPKSHLERILRLSMALEDRNSTFFNSQKLKAQIDLGLSYWFKENLLSLNWWFNEIGVPKVLAEIAIVLDGKLTQQQTASIIEITKRSKIKMTGQNKVWLAGIVLIRALLQKDLVVVKQAREAILSEIRIGEQEGIQFDQSFHQHGAQPQFGNYGAAFLASMSFWSSAFNKTSLQVPQNKLDILADLILNGYGKIIWRGYLDVNALGRQLFIKAQLHKGLSVAFSAKLLASIDLKNKKKYETMILNDFENESPVNYAGGYSHFWKSDQVVQRNGKWMASVKMSSKRVIGGESLNGCNLKGYYLGDGATYTYTSGADYYNIFPNWDWRKVPGVTAYSDSALKKLSQYGYKSNSNFVGSVDNGVGGFATMQLDRDSLKAKKSWLLTPNFVLCLGADINSDLEKTVTTSIDQRFKTDGLYALNDSGRWLKLSAEAGIKGKVSRLLEGNMGYIVTDATQMKFVEEERENSWTDIMSMYPATTKGKQNIFSLWLDHGKAPKNANYAYFILPLTTAEKVKNFDLNNVKILANDATAQVVKLIKEKTTYFTFFKADEIVLGNNIKVASKSAAMFILKENKNSKLEVYFSDPTQLLSTIEIEINGKAQQLTLPTGKYAGTTKRVDIVL